MTLISAVELCLSRKSQMQMLIEGMTIKTRQIASRQNVIKFLVYAARRT